MLVGTTIDQVKFFLRFIFIGFVATIPGLKPRGYRGVGVALNPRAEARG
jgi:hypothetical protein